MTTPGRVGRAYVEMVADFDKFGRETEKRLNAELKKVGDNADFDALERAAAKAGADSATTFTKHFDVDVRNGFRRTAANVGEEFVEVFDSPRNRNRFTSSISRLGRLATGAFGAAFSFLGAGSKGFGEFVQTFAKGSGLLESLGLAFTKAGSGIGSFLITLGAAFIIIPLILGPIMTLLSQLAGLIFLLNLLPGVTAIAVGAILPLIVSFEGMGEALGAVMEKDPEKLAEALKKLTPAARSVVKEVNALMPVFSNIRKAAQEAFFGPIAGGLTTFFKTVGEGRIAQGFANVAGSIGQFVASLLSLGSSPAFTALGELLFGTKSNLGAIAQVFQIIGPPINQLLTALAQAATTSMPVVIRFIESIAGGIERFATSIAETSADGRFNAFLESALSTANEMWGILKEIFGIFVDIFLQTDEGGRTFLADIRQALHEIREWMKSPEGKEGLKAMVDFAKAFAYVLAGALAILGQIIEAMIWIGRHTGLIPSSFGPAAKGQGGYTPRKMAEGGIVNTPTFALVGEAGREAVVPMDNPQRAAEVMSQAGLIPLADSMAGGGQVIVHVYLGTREITDILDKRVQRGLVNTARALAGRPRGAG